MSSENEKANRIKEMAYKVELNELRARDAIARCKIVEAEMKLLSLRETTIEETKLKGVA